MIRGSYSLALLLRHRSTKFLSKRQISFLEIVRNEAPSHLSVTRPLVFCGPRKHLGMKRVRMLTAVYRSVASEAELRRNMISEDVPELEQKQKKNTDMNAVEKFGSLDNFEEIKKIIGASGLKEDNLDLFWKLSQGNPDKFNKLRSCQMKINILSKILGAVPTLDGEKWLQFVSKNSLNTDRLLTYTMIKAIKAQKEKKAKYYDSPVIDDDDVDELSDAFDDPMCHHLYHNSLFMNVRVKALRKLFFSRAMASILYGLELFIDCSYDDYMTPLEAKYLSKQITEGVNKNLKSFDPFHIILCNFNKNSESGKCMLKYSQLFYNNNYPVTITSKSYLDFVPRENLVYLTPHCTKIMTEFDPNKRYIIGGFVDKSCPDSVSLAKAKENKIEMAKFPLDKYLNWQHGKKTLCVNHVMSIMLSVKNEKSDWLKAFEVLPKRNFIKREPGSAKYKKNSKVFQICRTVNRLHIMRNLDNSETNS